MAADMLPVEVTGRDREIQTKIMENKQIVKILEDSIYNAKFRLQTDFIARFQYFFREDGSLVHPEEAKIGFAEFSRGVWSDWAFNARLTYCAPFFNPTTAYVQEFADSDYPYEDPPCLEETAIIQRLLNHADTISIQAQAEAAFFFNLGSKLTLKSKESFLESEYQWMRKRVSDSKRLKHWDDFLRREYSILRYILENDPLGREAYHMMRHILAFEGKIMGLIFNRQYANDS